MRLKKYLVTEKIQFKNLKSNKESFYNKPEMVGHTWAKETVDRLETLFNKIVKTKKHKMFMDLLMDFESDDWNYFMNITKKDEQIYSYILRRIDKNTPYELLNWLDSKEGMMKSRLTHILEYLSYKSKDKDVYLRSYAKAFGFYGASEDEAKERFEKYHKDLEKYDYIKKLKNWK